jgi:flagellin
MVINSNIMSLNAQNQLTKSQNDLNTSMERLASGKRINSAADDAAGLAIANRMTSQIRGLDQAVRNANDGQALIQTAEGALDETTNILQRMRELSIQSANGTYDSGNRSTLNAEVRQLQQELTRIAETTNFNGQKLLDGSLGELVLQVGSEANQTISTTIGKLDASGLGATDKGVSSGNFTLAVFEGLGQEGNSGKLSKLTEGDLTINGVSVPAPNTSSDTISTSDNASSAISVAAAINSVSAETGVVAEATSAEATLDVTAVTNATFAEGELVINGVDLEGVTVGGATVDDLVAAINSKTAETGVVASVEEGTGTAAGKITFTSAAGNEGANIQIAANSGAGATIGQLGDTAGAVDKTYTGGVTLRSNEAINIEGNNPQAAGLTAGAVAANTTEALQNTAGKAATMELNVAATGTATEATFQLNGVDITYTGGDGTDADATKDSTDNLIAAINEKSGETGVFAELVTDGATSVVRLTAGLGDNQGITIGRNATAEATADTITVKSFTQADGTTGTNATGLFSDTSGTALSVAAAESGTDGTFDNLENGDLSINGFQVDFTNAQSLKSVDNERSTVDGEASAQFTALAINNTDGLKDQVVATAYTEMNLGKVKAGDAGEGFGLVVNGQFIDIDNPIADGDANGNIAGTLNAAFAEAAKAADGGDANAKQLAGLKASINDAGELLITANDGRNITVSVGGEPNGVSLLDNLDVTVASSVTAKGTVALEAKEGFNVGEIAGDKSVLAGIEQGGNSVADIDISTAAGAQKAIGILDNALEQVNNVRGDLGAISNRLDYTMNNLSNISENQAAARSRIEDADFAKESANLSRAQVLQQAGTAMLAQANAAPQQVLSLLQ